MNARRTALALVRRGNDSVRTAANQLDLATTTWDGVPNDRESVEYWDRIDHQLWSAMNRYAEARKIVREEKRKATKA